MCATCRYLLLASCLALGPGARGGNEPPPAKSPKNAPAVRPRTDRHGDPLPEGAVARLGTVRLRPGDNPRLLAWLPGRKALLSVAVQEESTSIAVWDAATGRPLQRLDLPGAYLRATAFSRDARTLAAAVSERHKFRVLVWKVAADRGIRPAGGWEANATALAFAPDGKTLAGAGPDHLIHLWDAARGTERRRFPAGQAFWEQLAFAADGKTLVAAGYSEGVRLWDVASGQELPSPGGRPNASCLAFAPGGTTLAVGGDTDAVIRLLDRATGKEVRRLAVGRGCTSLAFSPDGKLLASGACRSERPLRQAPIRLWDVATGREIRRLPGHLYGVGCLAFSADGKKLASAGLATPVRLWDVATGKELLPTPGHRGQVMSVRFSPDGRVLATASLDQTIRLWDPATGNQVRRFEGGHHERVWRVAFAPDGRRLASVGQDGTIRFWEVASGREVRKLPEQKDGVNGLEYSPAGKLLAWWGTDRVIHLADAATGKEIRRLPRAGLCFPDCFSPDGRRLASVSPAPAFDSATAHVWDVATGKEVRHWEMSSFGPVAFAPDGKTLAGASDWPSGSRVRTVYFWDVATGAERRINVPAMARMFCLAFAPDGRTLAWGAADGSLFLWELASGQVRRRLDGHRSTVTALAFAPDGKTLASSSDDMTGLVWDVTGLPPGERPRDLSAGELETLWADLAGRDADKAFRAVGVLAAVPRKAVPFLQTRLKPAAAADRRRVARVVADLDSPRFAVRQKAVQELERLGELAEPGLREALGRQPSAEVRRRLVRLLERLEGPVVAGEPLRGVRAVEALEHAGTPEARRLLKELAGGAAEARLTREAKGSLRRLTQRPAGK